MKTPQISIIVPIVERVDDLGALFRDYTEPLREKNLSYEIVCVLDERYEYLVPQLRELKEKLPELKIIQCGKNYGEANALMIGFTSARGDTVLTLASYFQVVPSVIPEMLQKLDEGNDVVITRRYPRTGNVVNRIQSIIFHAILHNVTQFTFSDISCGLRAMRVNTARNLGLSGNLHRFIPIIAHKQGKKVIELKATQRIEDTALRFHGPIKYVARLVDIVCLFFVINSNKLRSRIALVVGGVLLMLGATVLYAVNSGVYETVSVDPVVFVIMGAIFAILGGAVALYGAIGSFIRRIHAFDDRRECVIEAVIE